MLHALAALFFFMAQPFWEARAPNQWSDREVETMLGSSPWAQSLGPAPSVTAWFATAEPIEAAEAQARLRGIRALEEPDADYLGFLRENGGKVFVLAVGYPSQKDLGGESGEWTALEKQTAMTVGRTKYKLAGTFPPTPADPVLRLVFPLAVKPDDRAVSFRLYLPGLPFPERDAEFPVKNLTYRGKLAM